MVLAATLAHALRISLLLAEAVACCFMVCRNHVQAAAVFSGLLLLLPILLPLQLLQLWLLVIET
jgi:hypothetical protein